MSHFIEEFKAGQAGKNKGLPMGEGLKHIAQVINGVQKARMYGVAAAPKAGKSTFVDYGFVISPLLYALEKNLKVRVIYYSFEIDRVSKEFDFAAYFLFHDYGITEVTLPEGILKDGKTKIQMSSDYLRGRLQDDNGKTILVDKKFLPLIEQVYEKRIKTFFGTYDTQGNRLRKGLIDFIEEKENPTGLYKHLQSVAEKEGSFTRIPAGVTKDGVKKTRITGYIPKDPDKMTIVVTDHLRKLIPERNWQKKQTVDKYVEYTVELRNWCKYTFVHIIHLNRNLTSSARMNDSGDLLYPNSDDIKDTGNLAEDADYVLTIFNPNDERYNLYQHFGEKIKSKEGNPYYPFLRTVHLVESRHCNFPEHFRVNMFGGYKNFTEIKITKKQ